MKEKESLQPILFSIKAVAGIMVAYLFVRLFLQNLLAASGAASLALDGALRFAFALPAIVLLGIVVRQNGFRYVFSAKGSGRAAFASAAMLVFLLTQAVRLFNISEMNGDAIPMIPVILIFDTLSAVFEETVWRGLLMTALLMKWGGTAKGRIAIVLFCGAVFGLGHISNGMLAVLLTTLTGMGFCAMHLYSGNLIIPMLMHALWNHLEKIPNVLTLDVHSAAMIFPLRIAQHVLLYAIIPLFAIYIAVKAKPFHDLTTPAPKVYNAQNPE